MSSSNPLGRFRSFMERRYGAADDTALLTRYVEYGDQEAFELLVWRHYGLVAKVCRGMLRDHHAAEDATQAVFMIFAKSAKSIRNPASLSSWLYRAAHHCSIRIMRKASFRKMTYRADIQVPAPSNEGGDDADRAILDAIGTLAEKYRDVLVLCCVKNLTTLEAAKILKTPERTIATRLFRAKAKLKEILARRGVVASAALFTSLIVTPTEAAPEVIHKLIINSVMYAQKSPTASLGVTALTLRLANEGTRTIALQHVIAMTIVCAGLMGFLFLNGEKSGESTNRIAAGFPVPAPWTVSTMAPVAPQPKLTKRTIDAMEKLDLSHVTFYEVSPDKTFHHLPFTKVPYSDYSFSDWKTVEKVADSGSLSGFRLTPGAPLPEPSQFPETDVELGLSFTGQLDEVRLRDILLKYRLRYLSIDSPAVGDDLLATIVKIKSLQHLEIRSSKCTDEGIRLLSQLPDLRIVVLNCPKLTSDCFATVARMSKLQSLAIIGACTDVGIEELKQCKNLKKLHIAGNLTDKSIKTLASLESLESLTFHAKDGVSRLADFGSLPNLQYLAIYDMTPGGVARVATIQGFAKLKHLKVFATQMSNESVEEICKLEQLKSLDLLALSLDNQQLDLLPRLTQLERLRIFSDTLEGGLEPLGKLTRLQEIELILYADGILDFSGIKKWDSLKELKRVHIFTQAMRKEYVDELQCLSQIDSLQWIFRTNVKGAASELSRLKQLKKLSLNGPIDTTTIEKISTLPDLKMLTLTSATLPVGCHKIFAKLSQLATLKLFSSGCDVEDAEKIAKELPSCNITWVAEQGDCLIERSFQPR